MLVEQFRPGVMARLGLGYEAVRAINPRLVYCSISGYGQDGPRSQEAGHDLNYQARTGLLSLSPGTTGSPSVPPALVADIAGGSFPAVINILLALRRRDLTGEGCRIDVAMSDAMFTFAWLALAEGFATGRFPGSQENMLAGGSPRYALYVTADDKFLAVGALEPKFWAAFCHGIGLPERLRDDRDDPGATRAAIVALVRAEDGGRVVRRSSSRSTAARRSSARSRRRSPIRSSATAGSSRSEPSVRTGRRCRPSPCRSRRICGARASSRDRFRRSGWSLRWRA